MATVLLSSSSFAYITNEHLTIISVLACRCLDLDSTDFIFRRTVNFYFHDYQLIERYIQVERSMLIQAQPAVLIAMEIRMHHS
jgi:hypothetical protein